MKRKIGLITIAVALPGEKGYTRISYLAEILRNNGYDAEIITSSFQHWTKKQRECKKVADETRNHGYHVKFAYQPSYDKNITLKRIFSYHILTKNIINILSSGKYDAFYCCIPDNYLAAMVGRYAKAHKIPLLIDVQDLWPEAMYMVIKNRLLQKMILYPFKRYAKIAYCYADAIIGTSNEYKDYPLKYKISEKIPRTTVYVGSDIDIFDEGIKKNSSKILKSDSEFWVAYAGTLGSSYDIKTLLLVSEKLKNKYSNIKFKILGGGPLENDFKAFSNTHPGNVEFLGFVSYDVMAAYLSKADVTLNSFVKKAPQSIVNKIGDYLAAGKPMINTCSSKESQLLVAQNEIGINVEAENVDELMKAVLELYGNREKCIYFSNNARHLAEIKFDRKNSYLEFVNEFSRLINKNEYEKRR